MKYKIFFFIVTLIYIFSFNFQRVSLLSNLGSIGFIGEYYLLPLSFLFTVINFKNLKKIKINQYYFKYLFYFIILNIVVNIILLIFNKIGIYGELFIVKSLHLVIHLIFQIISINGLIYILKKLNFKLLKYIFNLNYLYLIGYFLYEKFYLNEIGRIKLLSPEPSIAGYTLSILTIITLYFNKNILIRYLIFFIYLILLLQIGSKGTILIMFMTLFITIFFYKKDKKRGNFLLKMFGLFFISLGFYITYYKQLKSMFISDLAEYTSLVTRSWSILVTIISSILFPTGVGGGYLLSLNFFGEKLRNQYMILLPNLNYSEINEMLSSGIYLAPKSGLFFNVLIAGIGYLIFQYFILKYFYERIKGKKILVILLSFNFLAITIYISDLQTPHHILIYSLLIFLNEKENFVDKK